MKILDKFNETIGVYENALSDSFCDEIINHFDYMRNNDSKLIQEGKHGLTNYNRMEEASRWNEKYILNLKKDNYKEFDL